MIDGVLSRFDFTPETGLVWVAKPEGVANDTELLAINEAKRFKADAVYFRRYENSNHSVPQVFIYDQDFSDDELIEIHTHLWSSGIVPLFYVTTTSEVKIYNCAKSREGKGKNKSKLDLKPIQTFSLIGDIQQKIEEQKFSARLFDNGTFWEEHPEILKVSETPYQKLLDGLLNAKKDLEQQQELALSPTTISKILIIGVLVKYLEEKKDQNGTSLLEISRDLYQNFPNCQQFTDVLRNGYIIDFLEELNKKFNGKVFDLKPEEKQELKHANLSYVAAVFDADVEGRQYVLWKLYDFNFLPIELISGIYEAFLKKERSVVYTPPYLVNLLIDECMPLDKAEEKFSTGNFKVLDPACGSGIFLVVALKRMVQWQAILKYKQEGVIAYPDIEAIKSIVKNNLFGVDIEEGATLISIFSLCIAICDKLSPMQIWNELRFDDLAEENILTANFFGVYESLKTKGFDLVIGNPPFNPPKSFSNKSYLKAIKEEFGIAPSVGVNDEHLALLFLDKAVELRKNQGKLCFILPSGPWLYNLHAIKYRSAFLKRYFVEKIFDFTHLSDSLFHRKTSIAVCATIVTDHSKAYQAKSLYHVIVKRSKVAEERFFFEMDHYDFHKIQYSVAIDSPYIWKCNVWGGRRLAILVDYLKSLRNLGDYLRDKKRTSGWEFGEGYIIGHDENLTTTELFAHGRKRKFYSDVHWITGKPSVETQSFNEKGEFKTFIEHETLFEWPRPDTKKIFYPPHILIKETLGEHSIPIVFSEDYLCFKDRILGVHAPDNDLNDLYELYQTLTFNQNINRLFALAVSGESGVSMSTFLLRGSDILNLPYPKNTGDLVLGDFEQIIQDDVLNYYLKSSSKSEKSPLNQYANNFELLAFGEVFCKTLNPIYEQNDMKWFSRGFQSNEISTAYVFCFGFPKEGILPDIFDDNLIGIEKLLFNTTKRNIRINRVLREYLHIDGYDVLILVKPKAIRYWLKSIALRDADETFADLKISGF